MILRIGGLAAALLAAPVLAQQPDVVLAALQERAEAMRESKGGPATYAALRPDFEAFADEHDGSEEALTARLWLLQQTWWLRKDGKMEAAAKEIATDILARYPRSKQLVQLAEYRYVFAKAERAGLFEEVHAKTPHDVVRAAMVYGLAQDASGDHREKYLRELRKKYADVRYRHGTYGEIADAHLNPHPTKALGIGQRAPDIVGRDVDGNDMKLSDYRGKVILLDFWGDW